MTSKSRAHWSGAGRSQKKLLILENLRTIFVLLT